MSDNKKKDGDGKPEEGKKKKGLPAIVLVAVGAALGGAGVVFAVPPKVVEKHVEPPKVEPVDVTHPDVIDHNFNPKGGRGIAQVKFKFVYTVLEDKEHMDAAFESIKQNWEEAKSHCLDILRNVSREELNSEAGTAFLRSNLVDELDRTLFPEHEKGAVVGKRYPRITGVIWEKILCQ